MFYVQKENYFNGVSLPEQQMSSRIAVFTHCSELEEMFFANLFVRLPC